MAQDQRDRGARRRAALAAAFDDLASAEAALDALAEAGVDRSDLGLVGPPADAPAGAGPARDRHDRAAGMAARRSLLGAVVGGAVGAVIGAALAAVITATTDTDAAVWVLALVGTGLLLGLVTGAFVGLERSMLLTDAWELALADVDPSRVWVVVRAGDGVRIARAAEVLGRLAPGRVRWAPSGAPPRPPG